MLPALGPDEVAPGLFVETSGSAGAQSLIAALGVDDRSAHEIFASPDDLKLRSCLTLFREVDAPGGVFARALEKYFGGEPDAATLELLAMG